MVVLFPSLFPRKRNQQMLKASHYYFLQMQKYSEVYKYVEV